MGVFILGIGGYLDGVFWNEIMAAQIVTSLSPRLKKLLAM